YYLTQIEDHVTAIENIVSLTGLHLWYESRKKLWDKDLEKRYGRTKDQKLLTLSRLKIPAA
ncbi:MAG: hypothetical protein AAFP89_23195, partial [Bacteroidota bacterium]